MKTIKSLLIAAVIIGVLALLGVYIANNNIPVLQPQGLIASKEKHLIVTCVLLMLIVVVPVYILAIVFAVRYRKSNEKARHEPDWEHNTIAEVCWWGIPLVIIAILSVIIWKSSHDLNPFKPLDSNKKPLVVQVVALEWKWLFLYPEQGIATVNWVQFPADTPINFQITADAPMNSFWIPALGGQIYAMPGMRAKLHLIADKPGEYRGVSANMSGTGFAGMTFTAKSCTEQDFDHWVQTVQSQGGVMDEETYTHLLEPSQYHSVTTYGSMENDLFKKIIMKYMEPPKKGKKSLEGVR
ncbi:ubiquinol oxidase subunit II [Candidatus Aerophobetes bacterium]|uniref:Ubiquinol oxidase polypeptide II n=1 Tax=Aerophobetes bacterium TaxID=2030807 RepID=A0A2A4X2A4_UNCAE|nr:MAG: ubiquinol oxidase subunit II [Candidatus Aerophobetes bacterium]